MTDLTPLEKELLRCVEDSLTRMNDEARNLSGFNTALKNMQRDFMSFASEQKNSTEMRLKALEDGQVKLFDLLRSLSR
ncbi:hypothetical protein [Profundibacter amoris]|uniref:Uncharacterized protein n=1 Tax=Profundibacter amoris TaxID=2171755 RepID=A0A347UGT6_9RHOB|nr:hypothetical protein [Profundibacter amoris]AXX98064.1 hypothetical protein BAR1_09045 [Profundibacter amoris]